MTTHSHLLGKQVQVRLTDETHDQKVLVTGKLLSYGDHGEFIIQGEDGGLQYCWPNLEMVEVTDDDDS